MASVAIYLSLIFIAFANAQAQLDPLVKVSAPFTIAPADYLKTHFVQPNYVIGARDCDGQGRTLQFTHTNCLPALPAVACLAEIDKLGTVQVFFVAGEDVSDVIIRPTIIEGGNKTVSAEIPAPDIHLIAGHPYVVSANGRPESHLLGKLFTGRVEVLKGSDKSVQACSETDFIGYKP